MNTTLKVLCTHCGRLIPETESDAHCATHEKTPIPAVASAECERPKCEDCSGTGNCGTCNGRGTRHPDNEPECKRAQADALDAQRYRGVRDNWVRAGFDSSGLDACVDLHIAALRTSSPDPAVPRGEDGEKGK